VQEEARVVSAQKIRNHLLGLASAAHDIHGFQNGNDVFEEELSIIGSPSVNRISL
jgi:hypothetical protein